MRRRIALSPWSKQAISEETQAELERRANTLGCWVSTVRRTRAPASWVVRAFSQRGRVEIRGVGPLEAIIAGALDDYEAAPFYTPDELAQIQRQSV